MTCFTIILHPDSVHQDVDWIDLSEQPDGVLDVTADPEVYP